MDRFICIHGHFYQPPRENPWTGEVELQESAHPYHDWNERITAECYSPNTAAPILDVHGKVERTVDNYSKMSFNFGPTLLSWMEKSHPEVYNAILRADRETVRSFSGHGSAMAQVYNHMIMPLANSRDKQTQVRWGVADFQSRFGRPPEGMWLPETAVDMKSLEVLAAADIRFTILGPHQAARTRRLGEKAWSDSAKGGLDTKRAYLCNLPSGRSISIFFYDQLVSNEIAFGGLLQNGTTLAGRMVGAFDSREDAQLVNTATDGETFGHHHRYGEMALAYCFSYIDSNELARITNYGEFLAKFPPCSEVQIIENTSWSCAHGVERWRSNCGCTQITKAGSTQEWRRPLRIAMDWLWENLATVYERESSKYLLDPWKARDEYITIILDPREETARRFIAIRSKLGLEEENPKLVLDLLEMEKCAMLMFTSCGWFWDEISRIETVQVLRYAGRAMQLANAAAGVDLEPQFNRILEKAPSNSLDFRNGSDVYMALVRPDVVANTIELTSSLSDRSELTRSQSRP
jgi:alpha-amylase/alpha-mannosidase (GH57 family)